MKPGERIRLITESVEALVAKPWSEANLILAEFGFETWEDPGYNIEDREYFTRMVRDGQNDGILNLHGYLSGEDAAPTQESDHPWGDLPVRAFLSHKWEDRVLVGRVKAILREHYAIDAFVAHDDIDPSKRWRDVIKAALATSDLLVAVLHKEFHNSQWCDQEVGWALGRRIPVVSVRWEGSPRGNDGFLEEHQDIVIGADRGTGEWYIARQVLQMALNDDRTHEKGQQALAEAFVLSTSWNETRSLWRLIEAEPRWESDQLRRLEHAVATNRQVYDADVNGREVPKLVGELVAKFEEAVPKAVDPWSAASTEPEPPF